MVISLFKFYILFKLPQVFGLQFLLILFIYIL